MEALGYIVVGLFLLFLVFVANLMRVVVRHCRVVREAHRARASSMLQDAVRCLDDAARQEPEIAHPPLAEPRVSLPRGDFTLPEVRREHEDPVPAQTPSIPETYSLVGPVELHFSGIAGRVGVKGGTPLQAEFLRIANLLLDDLASSRKGLGWCPPFVKH